MFFFDKRKIVSVIVVLLVLGFCGWGWRHRESVPFISKSLAFTTAPFEHGISRVSFLGKTGISILDQIIDNWNELEELKRENGSLKAEQSVYKEILAENMRYKTLLGFKERSKEYKLMGATTIMRDYGVWSNTLVIDHGEDAGLKKYMPVIVPEGIVGYIMEVYPTSARVKLLIDPGCKIGVLVQRLDSRVEAIASGNSTNPGNLIISGLAREADIVKGDQIIASGYGGVYPKGALVGVVENVIVDEAGSTQSIEIKPAVNFGRLEEVFVIMNPIARTVLQKENSEELLKEPPMDPNMNRVGE